MSYRIIISTVLLLVLAALLVLWPELKEICRNCRTTDLSISPKYFVKTSKSSNLQRLLDYNLQSIRRGDGVAPRTYLHRIPPDFALLENIAERKTLFIRILLPQILRINEHLLNSRNRLIEIKRTIHTHKKINPTDLFWLEQIAHQYQCDINDLEKLLLRVDIVPPSVALAQAAVESGWGTSRFAIEGRALFGQRTFKQKKYGLAPSSADNSNFSVVRFRRLIDSVWGYTMTLNTHPAYAQFRQKRHGFRKENDDTKGYLLANTLTRYSEHGASYTDLLVEIILRNNLKDFDNAKLALPNS